MDVRFCGVRGSTPAPGRNFPGCEKKSLPWIGKGTPVKVVGG